MDSRLEGLSQEIKVRGFPGKRETKNGLTILGSAAKFIGGSAKPPAWNQCDSRWWFYSCPLNRDHGLNAQRAVSYEEYATHQRAQDYWSVHRELWFYDAYNHGAIWNKRTYGLQISTHVYIHGGLHYIWDIKYALCTDICQSICQGICRRI